MQLYLGLHQPSDARHFIGGAVCISVNRLPPRRSLAVGRWIIDSGTFTEIAQHGRYRAPVADYAAEIPRWAGVGQLEAGVAQDWMCEPFICARTGKTVAEHQRLTIERYDQLVAELGGAFYAMSVLQGYEPSPPSRGLWPPVARRHAGRRRQAMQAQWPP